MRILILFSSLLVACSSPQWTQESSVDTFVLDSYRIKEGKQAILELQGTPQPPLAHINLQEKEEVIENNDYICITSNHQELSHLALQVIDGNLSLPSLATISVNNLTLAQAQEKILAFLPKTEEPLKLELSFLEKALHSVQLLGAVEKKEIQIQHKTRLLELLFAAGILPEADLFQSQIRRENGYLNVDFVRLLYNNDESQNILLQPNDTIIIPVAKEEITLFFPDHSYQSFAAPKGYLPLKQLLIQAKVPIAQVSEIKVVRNRILHPKIYTLDWRYLINLPEESLCLMQGDQVLLKEKTSAKIAHFLHKLVEKEKTLSFLQI